MPVKQNIEYGVHEVNTGFKIWFHLPKVLPTRVLDKILNTKQIFDLRYC